MRFEFMVATRYLRGKRKNRFVSLITVISVAGVSVGVIALIVVMSVMTGFDIALRETIIGNRAHLTVLPPGGQPMMEPERVMDDLENLTNLVVATGPIIQTEALIKRGERTNGAFLIGIDPEREQDVTDLATNLSSTGGRIHAQGNLPGYKEIVLGYRLAHSLGVGIGSEIEVITARPTVRTFGMSGAGRIWLRVSGISQARMSDFDNLYAFVDIETARMLTGREGVDGIHVKLTDPMMAERVARQIEQELPYFAVTWYESQEAFFGALEQEKAAMFIILVFIIVVAAFNITSTLIMIVMEKRRDVGILRTLGVGSMSILVLFMLEGLMIGLGGTMIGLVLGVILAYNITPVAQFIASLMGVNLFDSNIYYFDGIPVAVVWSDIVWVTIAAIFLTFLSTLYPAWSAARLNPVDALRYE